MMRELLPAPPIASEIDENGVEKEFLPGDVIIVGNKEYVYKDASVVLMENKNQLEYQHLFSFLNLSKDNETGKSIKQTISDQTKELKELYNKYINDDKARAEKAEKAYKIAVSEYNVDAFVQRLNGLVEFLINEKKL